MACLFLVYRWPCQKQRWAREHPEREPVLLLRPRTTVLFGSRRGELEPETQVECCAKGRVHVHIHDHAYIRVYTPCRLSVVWYWVTKCIVVVGVGSAVTGEGGGGVCSSRCARRSSGAVRPPRDGTDPKRCIEGRGLEDAVLAPTTPLDKRAAVDGPRASRCGFRGNARVECGVAE